MHDDLMSPELIQRYLDAKAQAARAFRLQQQLGAEIKSRMGAAELVQAGAYTVHWTRQLRYVVDTEYFKKSFPLIYDACLKLSESRRFDVKAGA
jgi:predicted phage-related endonuclease